jgi:transposase-like protein
MGQKRHTPEQIIRKLRQAEVELAKGQSAVEVARKLGITEQTYYRWRKEFGGLRIDQAKRLKELEKENVRLKKLVADQALDNAILKETAVGPVGCWARRDPPSGMVFGCRMTSHAWWLGSSSWPRNTDATDTAASRRCCGERAGE